MAGNILVCKFSCVCVWIYHVCNESIIFYCILLPAVVSLFRVLQFYDRNHKWAAQRVTIGDWEFPPFSTSVKWGNWTYCSSSNSDILWFYDSILLVHILQHWNASNHPQTKGLLFLSSLISYRQTWSLGIYPFKQYFHCNIRKGERQHFASLLVLQTEVSWIENN